MVVPVNNRYDYVKAFVNSVARVLQELADRWALAKRRLIKGGFKRTVRERARR